MWLVVVDVLVSFLVGLGCSVVCCVDFLLYIAVVWVARLSWFFLVL